MDTGFWWLLKYLSALINYHVYHLRYQQSCQHLWPSRSMKGGGKIKKMRYALMMISFFVTIACSAQSNGGCDCPPCAPGMAITVWQGSTPTVKVKCENTSSFDCFSLELLSGKVGPAKLTNGMSGTLVVNDGQGRQSEGASVTFVGKERDKDGTELFLFNKN